MAATGLSYVVRYKTKTSGIRRGETNILLRKLLGRDAWAKFDERKATDRREKERKNIHRKCEFLLAPSLPTLLQVEKQVDRKDCALVNARNPKAGGYQRDDADIKNN